MSLTSSVSHRQPVHITSPRNSIYTPNHRSFAHDTHSFAPSSRASLASSKRRSLAYDIPRTDNWPVRISATRASGNGARWADRLDASTTSGFGMIPSPRQVDASYSENLKLYLSVLEDSRKENNLKEEESSIWKEKNGSNSGTLDEAIGMERWDGHDGLGIALDALSGRFGKIQAPIGLRDAAAGEGKSDGRQKRLSQSYFGNSYRLSGAW